MSLRVLRRGVVLAALAAILLAALLASPLAYLAAGGACTGAAMILVGLDGLRKRGGPRL